MLTEQDTFLDDKPVFDWTTFQGTPARTWRHNPPKFNAKETAKLALFGFCLFLGGMTFLVLAFLYL